MPSEEPSWLSRALWSVTGMNVVAGTVAGIVGVLAGHPFDTIKVRLQSQTHSSGTIPKYRNTLHCLLTILREEKFKGLFKGVSSPLVGVTAINTLLFGVYGFFLQCQQSLGQQEPGPGQPRNQPTLQQVFIAGAGSGLVNSFISSPVELAKIQLQNQLHSNARQRLLKGPMDCLRQVWRQQGLRGIYRGMLATLWRETPSYGVYFACFEAMQSRWRDADSGELGSAKLMLAGGLSGIVGWMSTYPADVIKTKIQAQPLPSASTPKSLYLVIDQPAYRGSIDCLQRTWREEGAVGFFRGTTATIIRAFPTNAVIFTGYALTMRALEKINPFFSSTDPATGSV